MWRGCVCSSACCIIFLGVNMSCICLCIVCQIPPVDFWHYLHSSLISLLFIIRPSLLLRLYIYIYIYSLKSIKGVLTWQIQFYVATNRGRRIQVETKKGKYKKRKSKHLPNRTKTRKRQKKRRYSPVRTKRTWTRNTKLSTWEKCHRSGK